MKHRLVLSFALSFAVLAAGCLTITEPCPCEAGAGGSPSSTSASTGPGCPPCSRALPGGGYAGDELCPSSIGVFATLYACACADPGVCNAVCFIPDLGMEGDGPTCGLLDAAHATPECTDCLLDASATGCGAAFSACVADTGT